jgi:ATP-dependent DNA ligase
VKFDGYRMQAQIAGSEVRLLTRAGQPDPRLQPESKVVRPKIG